MLPTTTIGVVLAIMGTFMIVPASIGISEYSNADSDTKKDTKPEIFLQSVILAGSIIIMIIGYSIMYQSNTLTSLFHFGWSGHKNLLQLAADHVANGGSIESVTNLASKLVTLHGNEKAKKAMNVITNHLSKQNSGVFNHFHNAIAKVTK